MKAVEPRWEYGDEGRYIFVHRLDKTSPVNTKIPLHLTLLHWFKTEDTPDKLVTDLGKTAQNFEPIKTYATEEAVFGSDDNIPVMRLERTPGLLQLHLALIGLAKSCGAEFDERWVGEANWNPHVTHKSDKRLEVGDKVVIDEIDLIKRDPGGIRQIVTTVNLSEHRNF